MSSTTVYCAYWSPTHSARFSNSSASCSVHQSCRLPCGVELAPFIVEAMRQFMADGAAGVAIIRRVVHLGIEERRLQHARRES